MCGAFNIPVYAINVSFLHCTVIRYMCVVLQGAGIWYKCVLFALYRYTVYLCCLQCTDLRYECVLFALYRYTA